MGILEETAVKAKDAFDVVAKKTGEVWSVQKVKFNIASVNSQLSKDFETLGRICFEAFDSDEAKLDEESVAELKASIKEKLEKIKEYEDQLDAQKKVVICPDCGAKCPVEAVFCSKCGKRLGE